MEFSIKKMEFVENKFPSIREYVLSEVRKTFGKEMIQRGSADWSGNPTWLVKGDDVNGLFVHIDDDDNVNVIHKNSEDQNIDVIYNLCLFLNSDKELQEINVVKEFIKDFDLGN